jgi:hypothetical protein
VILSVPAGFYSLTFAAPGYQTKEIRRLEVPVAAQISLNISLTLQAHILDRVAGVAQGPSVPENGFIIGGFGLDLNVSSSAFVGSKPELGTLHSALSYLIDPNQLDQLPLQTRNVYSMLITAPSVKYEEATGRGLGISANGQRPSSSNYLMDGLEDNDNLLTGPLSPVAPEAIGEYRVATSNFSAEYGATGGFVANAISRSGGNTFHGEIYGYHNNPVLNAGTFVHNSMGIDLQPHQTIEGYSLGGPILRDRLVFASSFEHSYVSGRTDPEIRRIPVLPRIQDCAAQGGKNYSQSIALLRRFPLQIAIPPLPAGASPCDTTFAETTIERPVGFDRYIALDRLDYRSAGGAHRLMGRLSYSRAAQEGFLYSPFKDFNGNLSRPAYNVAAGYTRTFKPGLINELRFGWRDQNVSTDPPHPEVPAFFLPPPPHVHPAFLPGDVSTPIAVPQTNWETNDSLALNRGRHVVSVGGGLLLRRIRYRFAQLQVPLLLFNSESNFLQGAPAAFLVALNRATFPAPEQPSFEHNVSSNQFHAFFQDSVRVTSHFTLNFGFRYESFGAFTNTSTQDYTVRPASPQAMFVLDASQHQSPFQPDRNNFAGRLGIAYNFRNGTTVLKAGYGVFYDRPFDNLFLNPTNNSVFGIFSARQFDYSRTFANAGAIRDLVTESQPMGTAGIDPPLWIDRNLRTPYVQTWFGGLQQEIARNLYVELSHMESEGRKLITSDMVNRDSSLTKSLPAILYRSNSGSSSFADLATLVRYRTHHGQFQASYTWSHSIDNQSEPMRGDPFNLSYTNPDVSANASVTSVFTRQFDSRVDRGNSDFDIRHDLVFFSIWEVPRFSKGRWARRMSENWRISQLGEFRTGLPYTVFASGNQDLLLQNRANLVAGVSPLLAQPIAVKGGEVLLNPQAFDPPKAGYVGTLGRNGLSGPGFWNFDLSLSRSFDLPWLGDAGKLQVRADAFNLLNHANLGNPINTTLKDPDFGKALFGAVYPFTIFPPLTAFSPTARRIQLQVKVYF